MGDNFKFLVASYNVRNIWITSPTRTSDNIYLNTVNKISWKYLYIKSVKILNHFCTFYYCLRLTNKNYWDLNVDLFLDINREKVDMPEVTSNWISLCFVNQNILNLTINGKFNKVSSTCLSVNFKKLRIINTDSFWSKTVTVNNGRYVFCKTEFRWFLPQHLVLLMIEQIFP